MSISNRIQAIESRHYNIETKIRDAYLGHKSDEEISELKKKKLQLKDELQSYEGA